MDSDPPPPTEPSPPSPGSNYAPLVLGTLALFVIAVTTVSRYGNLRSHPWYVSTVCIIGWCFPFWIVLLLPVDLASSTYDQCQGDCRVPFSHVSQSFLYVAWRTLYWTSFCLTWVMIPMMQAYVNTGDFGFTNRLKSAVRVNLQFYSIYIVIGFFGLIYLVFGSGYTTREKIQGFVMAMANSWGLFLVIMFMGYGLVAVPRRLWFTGNPQKHLNQLYGNASRVKEECMDSELEFIEVCKIMHAISKLTTTRADPFLRGCVDQMIQRFPFILDPEYTDRDNSVSLPRDITEDYLIKLNRRMIIAARMKDRKLALWENLLEEAFYLQDIIENRNNSDHQFHSTLRPLRESTRWNDIKAQLEWWWLLRIEPIFHRGVALLCAVLSVCILWSEIVFNIKNPVVSIVALGLRACGYNYAAVEFMAFFTLMFMCICVYTSLFKVRFFNLYILIPKHHTDENSLLWFTSYMCKMMAPLCYNYINLAGDFSGTSESVFNRFMGGADLVPFLGTTFIDWFPIVILIPALSVLFNFQGRCLGLCGVKDPYDDEEAGGRDSDGVISLNVDIADGKALVIEERGVRERTINPHLADQRGFLSRARNALGAYTSKYNRGPYNYSSNSSRSLHTLGGGNTEGRTPLSATLRQERDRRIDEILSGRTTPSSFSNNSRSSNQYSQVEDEHDGLHGHHSQQDNAGAAGVGGLLSFGDTVKNKLNDLFTKKSPGGPGAVSLSPESESDTNARQQEPLLRPDSYQGRRGRRVFGQPPSSSSSSSSPEQHRRDITRSRSPSPPPPPTTGLGLSSTAGPTRSGSPFARFDSKGRDMNNIFSDL